MSIYHSAGRPVTVGLTDTAPRHLTPMSLDEFNTKICGQYDDQSLTYTFIHINCPGQSVTGRYLVVQTNSSRAGHIVCEIEATVEGKSISCTVADIRAVVLCKNPICRVVSPDTVLFDVECNSDDVL